MNQVQPRSSQGAHASHITGVRRDFGLEKHDMQHGLILGGGSAKSSCGRGLHSRSERLRFRIPASAVPPTALKSIVLVDDEKSYTELLTQMLAENLDCPVHAYSRPLDALK